MGAAIENAALAPPAAAKRAPAERHGSRAPEGGRDVTHTFSAQSHGGKRAMPSSSAPSRGHEPPGPIDDATISWSASATTPTIW